MTASEDYRARVIMSARQTGQSKRISEARAQFDREQALLEEAHAALFVEPDMEVQGVKVLGVLTGQVPIHMAEENEEDEEAFIEWCRKRSAKKPQALGEEAARAARLRR